jgi:hypothetical protein
MSDPPALRDVAVQYHAAGWAVIELPAGAKAPPPDGRTGYGGSDMTAAEIATADWSGNVGLRMPADVLGLDVDAYKGGSRTLDELLARCGSLPNTWISHSGRNDGSGIRFYRVPPGMTWVTGLAGMDIIQRGHRYAAVYPSIHPTGRPYRWLNQAEPTVAVLPAVEDLPELPWPWIGELSRAQPGDVSIRSQAVDLAGLSAFIDEHNRADQPSYIGTILAHFTERWRAGYSRHDTMQHCLIWALECVRAGIAAGRPTLHQLGDLWVEAVSPDTRRAQLTSDRRTTEFEAMTRHAVGKVRAKPEAEILRLHDDIAGIPMHIPAEPERTAADEAPVIDVDRDDDGLPRPLDWVAFAERDETERAWLVEAFWPWGRAMALWAAAKTGKSEIALWCAAKLALGEHPWTGAPVEPVDVGYFDFEMTEDDLDDRLAAFNIEPGRLGRLHYFLLPALHALDVEQGGREVERLVTRHGARAVVFDTFGRAVGGEENEADTVRAFYRHTGSRLKRLGIGYLRTDHAGKDRSRGQRGSSAKRDDVDIVWSMTRTKTGTLLDCRDSSRLSWVGPTLQVERAELGGVLSYSAAVRLGWPAGTAGKVADLDALGVRIDASKHEARTILRAAGKVGGRNDLLSAALRFRRERAVPGPVLHGDRKGTEGFQQVGDRPGTGGDQATAVPSDQHFRMGTFRGTEGDQH